MSTTLTDDEQRTIEAALPAIQQASPQAAKLIRRLVRASRPQADGIRPYVTVSEAAKAFDVTPQTVRNWVDRGWLPGGRTKGGARRIPREALASALAVAGPRPPVPDLSAAEVAAIVTGPRRKR